jgi:uncharacterized protein with HEPN domain
MPLDTEELGLVYDMLVSARRTLRYVSNRSISDLETDEQFEDAVHRRIEIIGEAARGLRQEMRDELAHIPWTKIIRTRHIIAHDYNDINRGVIWQIATVYIPLLIPQLEEILNSSGKSDT